MKAKFSITLSITIFVVISILSLSDNGYASPKSRKSKLQDPKILCPVAGIKANKKYFLKDERLCFQKESTAKAQGYIKFKNKAQLNALIGRSIKRAKAKATQCNIVAIPAFGLYFTNGKFECFNTQAQALKKKFTHLETPTPVSTVTQQGNPTPSGTPIAFSFDLGPSHGHTEYSGHCEALMNSQQDNFSFTCTHNVIGATVSHFHLLDNTQICKIDFPLSPFSDSCPITPEQAALIKQGSALIDLHDGPGEGSDQVLAGLVIAPD